VVVVLEMLQRRISVGLLVMGRSALTLEMYIPLSFVVPDRKIVRVRGGRQLVCSLDLSIFFVLVANQILLVMTGISLQWRRNCWGPEGDCFCEAWSHVVYF
jgi:hypothetical protein